MLGWRTDVTILLTGLVVIVYTAAGGSEAVNVTQKYQIGVIFCGMVAAFVVLLRRMPPGVGLDRRADAGRRLPQARRRSISRSMPSRRYTFWSGLLGGFFLALSYFGTDQSQVQRYLSGASLRESRLGLMFNAVLKIPMQFFILLLGAMVFVFYQFEPPPVFFNQAAWESGLKRDPDGRLRDAGAAVRRRSTPRSGAPSRPGSTPGTHGDRAAEAGARDAGAGRPRPERGGAGRGEGRARVARRPGRSRRTPTTSSSPSSSTTCRTG